MAPYTQKMQSNLMKAGLVGAWVLAVLALGYVLGLTSVTAWAGLAVLSLVPPAVAAYVWSAPSTSMSESIRDVLR